MAGIEFANGHKYAEWSESHRDHLVLNVGRGLNSRFNTLHRTTCSTLTRLPPASLVSDAYTKVGGQTVGEIAEWIERERPEQIGIQKVCSKCRPIEEDDIPTPSSIDVTKLEDERQRVLIEIVARQGQGNFRRDLLKAYGEKCAITGCEVPEVLDAAHIIPYLGPHTDRLDNGLLLRSDLHNLFDMKLMWIDDDRKIRVSPQVHKSEYWNLRGTKLRDPQDVRDRPNLVHLRWHRLQAESRYATDDW